MSDEPECTVIAANMPLRIAHGYADAFATWQRALAVLAKGGKGAAPRIEYRCAPGQPAVNLACHWDPDLKKRIGVKPGVIEVAADDVSEILPRTT